MVKKNKGKGDIMRYLIGILLLGLSLVSCKDSQRLMNEEKLKSKYSMDCVSTGLARYTVYRCENQEIICYTTAEDIRCNWK